MNILWPRGGGIVSGDYFDRVHPDFQQLLYQQQDSA